MEYHGFTTSTDDCKLIIINTYVHLTSSCPSGYTQTLTILFITFEEDNLIVGDFNSNNIHWFSHTEDDQANSKGMRLAESLNFSTLNTLNED